MPNVPSKSVLITGCSTGIGRVTAERLLANGWKVTATARRVEAVKDLADKGARVLSLDVTDEDSMSSAVAAVEEADGAVGVLINNAGYGLQGPVEEVPMDEVRRQFETNVFGLVRMCQLVLPGMRSQRWGRIVNISSIGGKLVFPGGALYHGTKHAVEAISDAMRFEVRPFGVKVILVEPGTVLTPFGDTATSSISTGGPYAAFKEGLADTVKGAYEGTMAKMAISPDKVAKVIEKAIASSRPKARYAVGAPARMGIAMRRVTPDRMFDAVLRSQFRSAEPTAED
ncbi:MAG TPA: oxidoreductase [Actinomycetota bacterium]|nr:oxidoreductase [Actinomycetota bacterium]